MKIAYIYDAVYPWIKGGGRRGFMRLVRGWLIKGMRFTGMGLDVGR